MCVFVTVGAASCIWPFAVVVVLVVLGMHRDAQAVKAGVAGRFDVEMEVFGEKGGEGFLDGGHVCTERGKGGENHVAAGPSDAVEPDVLSHALSIHRSGGRFNRKAPEDRGTRKMALSGTEKRVDSHSVG